MSSAQNSRSRARKNMVVAGGIILMCVTLLSCVSSFFIYKEGFADTPRFVQWGLSLFAVIVVEGTFVFLVYGFTRAFTSLAERIAALAGMAFIVAVMLTNIITHFMMVKGLELNSFQHGWINWGAVSVFIAVLVLVLLITCADPVTRLFRMDLRLEGKQQETILTAQADALESDRVAAAIAILMEQESDRFAARLLGDGSDQSSSYGRNQPQAAYRRPGKDSRR